MVEQLVERIRQKDQRAMSQLYQMYIEELSSVCYRYVPSESDAKDVLQNSFVKIFTSVPTIDYRDEPSFRGWMKKVVVNEALTFLKEKKKLQFMAQEIDNLDIPDDEPSTERITADELHQLISELPDGYRTVMNLYVFEGYSHKKIAESLGFTPSTSASQLYFAKRLLSKKVKELLNKRK
ncbi:RNA polymerase sigma-70 factor, ECF subfamily [Prevotella sp. ne3005]|jgi:RNA polymerase sigma-70 factor (ECF subfamily)|uniref:RNA polymerase sigma factor n=1 Tax=Prevotella sp. ne3005 TaxID=1761887 RepID=UPI0008C4E5C0|nr:sigma-70 family RNA polymerase sigma factor [Prevotella sp. ne3005]SEM69893.1 RNA polymerase sigma-70 factor, ECF subfamily [Prevotella sp. ne3005]